MKILHVETGRHLYGGARQVAWLLEGLRARGVDNVLVCPPGSGIAARARSAARVVTVPCAGDLDLRFARRLRALIARERPGLVHCHSRRGADFLGGRAAHAAGVPALVSRRVDHREPAWLAALRYRPYRKLVAISDNVAAALAASGVDEGRIVLIRSAVDADACRQPVPRRTLCESLGFEESHFLIAAIGQLIPRKGHARLLEAMARVLARAPGARLAIFGQGPERKSLQARAAALGIAGAVRFAGFRDDLERLLGAFDLVVHPALAEGLGVAMLEAAAAGRAVVAFDVAGAREAVLHRVTGLLAAPGDAAALAEAMLEMIEDDQRRAAFGAAGGERMRAEFSIDAMADQHLDLYRSLRARAAG